MKAIKDIRRQNLLLLIAREGSLRSLAMKLGRSSAQVSQWKLAAPNSSSGKPRVIGDESARYIEQQLGLPDNWMDTDRTPDDGAEPAPLKVTAWEHPDELADLEVVWLKRRRVQLSAGSGNLVFEEEDKNPLPFAAGFLRDLRLKPADAVCVYARGDSMAPGIRDGDLVLLNLTQTTLSDGLVYALRYFDQVRLKRLFRKFDGSLILRSDNASYQDEVVPPEYLDGNVAIIGQVVYRSGPYD